MRTLFSVVLSLALMSTLVTPPLAALPLIGCTQCRTLTAGFGPDVEFCMISQTQSGGKTCRVYSDGTCVVRGDCTIFVV